ncbi:hypothetical protein CsSME_00025377 [Camellia sinensis var. sinensis]
MLNTKYIRTTEMAFVQWASWMITTQSEVHFLFLTRYLVQVYRALYQKHVYIPFGKITFVVALKDWEVSLKIGRHRLKIGLLGCLCDLSGIDGQKARNRKKEKITLIMIHGQLVACTNP